MLYRSEPLPVSVGVVVVVVALRGGGDPADRQGGTRGGNGGNVGGRGWPGGAGRGCGEELSTLGTAGDHRRDLDLEKMNYF